MSSFKFTLGVLFTYTVLVIFYTAVVTKWPNPTLSAETNVVAGQIRLQSLWSTKDDYSVLSGTSLIARLPASAVFEGHDFEAVNMGIDGGSPLYSIKKINQNNTTPKMVIIETNLINKPLSTNSETLESSANSIWFRASLFVNTFKKENRISTRIYGLLKQLKDANTSGLINERPAHPTLLSNVAKKKHRMSQDELSLQSSWVEEIRQLKNKGSDILLTHLPQNGKQNVISRMLAENISIETNTPILDLAIDSRRYQLQYSDGTHLTQESAVYISKIINQSIAH